MNKEELIQGLRESAEWAAANEWETPIMLSDYLTEAANVIESNTMQKALAEAKALCRRQKCCAGCPLELPRGCMARVPDEDMDDYPMNWAINEVTHEQS